MSRRALAGLLLGFGCGGEPDRVASVDTSTAGLDGTSSSDEGATTPGSTPANDSSSDNSSASNPATTGPSDGGDDPDTSTGEPALPPMIGLVQYNADAHFGDYAFNRASLTMWAEAAIAQGATIVVFPEGSSYGYASSTETWCAPGMSGFAEFSCRDVATVAEALPGGPSTEYWASFAAEHDVTVVFHVPEVDGAAFYNAIGVVDPQGFVARYRKRTLYYVDAAYASTGDESVVIDTPAGRFGLMICLDGTYDDGYYDEYAALGVDGIIIPMDWDDDPEGPAAAITWFRERADVNDVRIYAADVSTWDGTALYLPGDVPRQRNGLPAVAVGIDGISVHAVEP